MADKIQIKRSSVVDSVPLAGDLAEGELALNLADEKIYAKNADGVVKEFPKSESVDVGVESVNDITGEVDINGSNNISVTKSGQNLTLDVKDTVALKTDVPAPVNLVEGTGIEITGNYPNQTITNEVTDLGDLSSVTIDTNAGIADDSVLTWNGSKWVPGTGGGSSDGRTTVNGLGGPVTLTPSGSVSITQPSPNNGNEIVISAASGIPEANSDGKTYGRKDTAWVEIQATGGDENVQSNWTETNQTSDAFILNKPSNLSEFNNDLTLPPVDAEKNVQSNWTEADTDADAFIQNKPTNLSQFNNDINISADNVTGLPVTNLESGNGLTLNVNDEGNGTWTLTALNQGGGGGGGGNLNLIEGDCIRIDAVENETDSNVTDVTIGLDTDCDSITSNLPISSTDGTVNLDSPSANTFTVSTGGSESFKIAANKDATLEGHVGVMSQAFSTASIALQGEVEPVNAGGAFGVWVSPTYVVDPDATYAKHARAFASVKAPANGQAFDTFTQFYASAVCGNTVGTNFGVYVSATGAINNVGCCVTKGGVVQAGNWGFYDNTGYESFLQGGLKTASVSGTSRH